MHGFFVDVKYIQKHFIDQHILLSVIPAKLEDAVSYSDFSQEVPLQKVLAQDLLENQPDDSLLQDILSGDTPINETEVHVISSGKFNDLKVSEKYC